MIARGQVEQRGIGFRKRSDHHGRALQIADSVRARERGGQHAARVFGRNLQIRHKARGFPIFRGGESLTEDAAFLHAIHRQAAEQ